MNRRSALAMVIAGAVIFLPLFSAWGVDPIAFGPADSYTVASTPYRMATGDFNQDGKPDIAVAHDNTNYSILMNNGDGTFTKTGGVISGARLRDVTVVTLAGDTISDLVFTDWNSPYYLRVFAGDGLGGFSGPATYAEGGASDGIVAGDFNKDGFIDVAVAKRSASQVGVLLGNGGGGFDAVVNYGAGGAVMEVAAGLVNGDTVLDLVTANYTSDNIGVLIGNGSGGFGAVTTIAAGNDNTDVALGDVTSDGLLDAVISNNGADGVVILKGDGLGGFSLLKSIPTGNDPLQVRLSDLNGNGLLDIATANRGAGPGLSAALSYGFGHFTSAYQFHPDQAANGLAIIDVDPAGLPDIATAHPTVNVARVIKGVVVDTDADALADGDEPYYFTNTSADDTDGDLMPDGLEVKSWCLRPAINNGGVDSDGDSWSNLAEYQGGTDPCDMLADTDGDLMDNTWENAHSCLNAGVPDGSGDFDFDTLTNVREYRLDTDPCATMDADGDEMPDGWEDSYACVDSLVGDSTLDPDNDTLDNLGEYLAGKDPCIANDSDGDLMPDHFEGAYFCLNSGFPDGDGDYDSDFGTNYQEYAAGTDPCVFSDTDGDGMPDAWENMFGCVSASTADRELDPDADLKTNWMEYLEFSDPCVAEDFDDDGMPDDWENLYTCVDRLVADADGNPDADIFSNLEEYYYGTDPCVAQDGDGDGMPDLWEGSYPCLNGSVNDAALDFDHDYLSNLSEYQLSTDPCAATDSDGDGLPDGWEELFACVDRLAGDSTLDPDADTLDNLAEFMATTDPCTPNDGDQDGMPDHYEVLHGCLAPLTADGGLDPDSDQGTNLTEFLLSTDPCLWSDTDGDLMPDGFEAGKACLDRFMPDGGGDPDGDSATNLLEYEHGANPCLPDTDGDGMDDSWEINYPCLDPLTADAARNPDGDIYTNLQEFQNTTDPCAVTDTRGRVCIVIPPALSDLIADSLLQYQTDLEQAQFSVVFLAYTSQTPQQLRAALAALYAEPASLAGAVLIGNIPYARFNDSEVFPCDLYYMDLDGTWTGDDLNAVYISHTGARSFEIWTSRIKADNLPLLGASEAELVSAYFLKDHRYRIGQLTSAPRALIYVDDDLACGRTLNLTKYAAALENVYGPGSVSVQQSKTYDDIMQSLFTQEYEWVNWASHASTTCFSLGFACGGFFGCVCSQNNLLCGDDIVMGDPRWLFSVVGGCSASAFPYPDYITGIMTFRSPDYGLITMGSTRAMNPSVITFMEDFSTGYTAGFIMQNWYNTMLSRSGLDVINFYGGVIIGDGALQLRMSEGDYDRDSLPNNYENAHACLSPESDDAALDPDGDGLSNVLEFPAQTDPCGWDSDGDLLPDGYEYGHLDEPIGGLDPLDSGDAFEDPDGDGIEDLHEYWNKSNPWSPDPAPPSGYEVGCYYWGKSDGGIAVQPKDIGAMQKAYMGVSVDYSRILPQAYDPLDLDRDMFPGPGDIALAQAMYAGLPRPEGYASTPVALTVEDAPAGPVAVGDTTHITVSVHAAGPAAEEFSPGMGVVFWVESGNAVLLGGEGTVASEAAGNRYDVSMKGADGAPANMVVLITSPGPVVINAKVPGCGVEPLGRWCGEVQLAAPVEINP